MNHVVTEYLALSTLCTQVSIRHSPTRSASMIQIWSLDTSVRSDLARDTTEERGSGLTFKLGLCITIGEAFDLQWCPKGGEIDPDKMESDDTDQQLGLLAGTFTDGSISIFLVPNPQSLPARKGPGPRYSELSS
jgi:transcription factor C subunit 6